MQRYHIHTSNTTVMRIYTHATAEIAKVYFAMPNLRQASDDYFHVAEASFRRGD